MGVARTLSRPGRPEQAPRDPHLSERWTGQHPPRGTPEESARGAASSAADCLYPMDYYRTLIIGTPGCYRRALGTMVLTRVPRIQVCRPPTASAIEAGGGLDPS